MLYPVTRLCSADNSSRKVVRLIEVLTQPPPPKKLDNKSGKNQSAKKINMQY